jgi:RNA polymerase sigma-70 factor (ECF subfamily)
VQFVSAGTQTDREAFLRVVRVHDARLRAVVSRMVGGDRDRTDDVLQEAYLRAFRSFDGFRAEADVGTWLHRIAHNACIDELRRGGRRPVPVDTSTWDGATPAADGAVADADVLRRALAALPVDQRAAVLLVDGEDLDHETAAAILGVAPGTVASRLSRARRTLRQLIGEDR